MTRILQKINLKSIQLILGIGLIFFLPFGGQISSYFLGGIMLLELSRKGYYSSIPNKLERGASLYIFYALHIIAIFYSNDLDWVLADLETKLPLILFPMFLPEHFFEKKNKRILLSFFILGLILISIYNYYNAFNLGGKYFYYKWFSKSMHPSYYSALLLIALAIIVDNLKNSNVKKITVYLSVIVLLFLITTIYYVSSRYAYIVTVFLVIYYSFKFVNNKIKRISLLVVILAGCILVFYSLNSNQRFNTIKTDLLSDIVSENPSSIRIEAWKRSIEISKDNLIFGVGPSDVIEELNVSRFDEGRNKLTYYNAHNQFLESFTGLGLLGLVSLLLIFYSFIYDENRLLNISFVFIYVLFFMSETILNRRDGVFSFSLFYILFAHEIKFKNLLKIFIDKIVAFLGLIVLLPVFCVIGILIKIKMPGSIFFTQYRVGQYGKNFKMVKFRTMIEDHDGSSISVKGENRITPLGAQLRKYKLDELPELWNILKGDMSVVGPRPDVPGYADKLEGESRLILNLKPGITGPASIKYANEEEILANVDDPINYNNEVIYPDKVRINLDYYYTHNLITDLRIIWRTIFRTNY